MPPTRFVVAPLPQAAQPPQLRTSLLRSRKEFKRAEGANSGDFGADGVGSEAQAAGPQQIQLGKRGLFTF